MAELCHQGGDSSHHHTSERMLDNHGAAQRNLFDISHHLAPPLSDGDSWPHGRWGRCSQSCEIATLPRPSLLFHPPTNLTPHSHRRSICPRRRLDTSLETGSRQPQPKYADCRLQYKGSSSNTVFLCGLESSFKCRFFPNPF